MKGRSLTGALALLAILAFALPASAQLQRGAIYGTVLDNTGAVLPGVTVTLTSNVGAPKSTVSGSQGEWRFAELDPGTYTIAASLQGFAPFSRKNIIVNVGSSINLPIQMALAGVTQQVTVTAATPVLDERTHGNTSTFGDAVLNEVPTARDPWALMQQVPGVVQDRVNVGGSQSGQQSTFSARGDNGTNTMWNIDGVTITDMGAIGSSPTYYNFDVFQEVQYSTGLVDPRQQTGALGINMVTKRGTNDFHGQVRYFFDNLNLQSSNLPSTVTACGPGQTPATDACFRGNRINQIADYGGDVGGPIIKNKLWFWGSLARNDIRLLTINDLRDNTRLDNAAAKIDFQATSNNHLNVFYLRGNKVKRGRNAGISRPQETTWDQNGPTNIYKLEDSHTFGQHFLANARVSYVGSWFSLFPEGGLTPNVFYDADNDVWHGSYQNYFTNRPQYQANVDTSYFKGKHEMRFGFQWRRTPVMSASEWPGGGVYTEISTDPANVLGVGPGQGLAILTRNSRETTREDDFAGYVGDTISLSRLTIEAALRFDRQNGQTLAASVPASTLFPNVLPPLSIGNGSPSFTWNNWSPRIGATFRVDDKTNVRASYALYESQLPAGYLLSNNPVALAGAVYAFTDPGNHVATPANTDTSVLFSSYGFNPAAPNQPFSPNTIASNLTAPRTHAAIIGLDREIIPNFAISTSFNYARNENVVWARWLGIDQSSWVVDPGKTAALQAASAAVGVPSTEQVFVLAPGVTLPAGSGSQIQNRPGYHQRYWSWDITATKRLSNRWMFRGNFVRQNNQEYYDNPSASVVDPQAMSNYGTGLGFAPWITTGVNGNIVLNAAGFGSGSFGDVYIMSKWQYSVMGLYQLPMGFQVSGTVYGRQGYPSPQYFRTNRSNATEVLAAGLDPSLIQSVKTSAQVLVNRNLDAVRNPNVNVLDLRVEKTLTFRGVGAVLSVDAFNVANNNVVLQVNRQVNSPTFGEIREILSPRVFRVGARFQF